jgi:hypothetical protein
LCAFCCLAARSRYEWKEETEEEEEETEEEEEEEEEETTEEEEEEEEEEEKEERQRWGQPHALEYARQQHQRRRQQGHVVKSGRCAACQKSHKPFCGTDQAHHNCLRLDGRDVTG